MADGTTYGILLLADISGYTDFVRQHARSSNHARQITVRLLKALVSATGPPLSVAELEGDAVFFYALGRQEDLPELAKQVGRQIPRLFRAFAMELKVLLSAPKCQCHSCAGMGELRLKQVVHAGEVAVEKIGRFEKLFGLAVIIVHRMLKNSVPAREYLMVSDPAFRDFEDLSKLVHERRTVELDGIGEHAVVVFYPKQLARLQAGITDGDMALPKPPLTRVLSWAIGLRLRTLWDRIKTLGQGPAAREPG